MFSSYLQKVYKKENLSSLIIFIFILLLLLQFGVLSFQIPDVWQVLELGPFLLYPALHEKDAIVPTGYSPFT